MVRHSICRCALLMQPVLSMLSRKMNCCLESPRRNKIRRGRINFVLIKLINFLINGLLFTWGGI